MLLIIVAKKVVVKINHNADELLAVWQKSVYTKWRPSYGVPLSSIMYKFVPHSYEKHPLPIDYQQTGLHNFIL